MFQHKTLSTKAGTVPAPFGPRAAVSQALPQKVCASIRCRHNPHDRLTLRPAHEKPGVFMATDAGCQFRASGTPPVLGSGIPGIQQGAWRGEDAQRPFVRRLNGRTQRRPNWLPCASGEASPLILRVKTPWGLARRRGRIPTSDLAELQKERLIWGEKTKTFESC